MTMAMRKREKRSLAGRPIFFSEAVGLALDDLSISSAKRHIHKTAFVGLMRQANAARLSAKLCLPLALCVLLNQW